MLELDFRSDGPESQEVLGPMAIYDSKSLTERFPLKEVSGRIAAAEDIMPVPKTVKAPSQLPLKHTPTITHSRHVLLPPK